MGEGEEEEGREEEGEERCGANTSKDTADLNTIINKRNSTDKNIIHRTTAAYTLFSSAHDPS